MRHWHRRLQRHQGRRRHRGLRAEGRGGHALIVGAGIVELHVHGSRSLKQKRGVVRSITQRVRNRFNLSVAEVGGQDTWQRACIGLGCVGADEATVRRQLEKALGFIEELHLAEVLGSEVEILDLPEQE